MAILTFLHEVPGSTLVYLKLLKKEWCHRPLQGLWTFCQWTGGVTPSISNILGICQLITDLL